jgi:hypothetical protein
MNRNFLTGPSQHENRSRCRWAILSGAGYFGEHYYRAIIIEGAATASNP